MEDQNLSLTTGSHDVVENSRNRLRTTKRLFSLDSSLMQRSRPSVVAVPSRTQVSLAANYGNNHRNNTDGSKDSSQPSSSEPPVPQRPIKPLKKTDDAADESAANLRNKANGPAKIFDLNSEDNARKPPYIKRSSYTATPKHLKLSDHDPTNEINKPMPSVADLPKQARQTNNASSSALPLQKSSSMQVDSSERQPEDTNLSSTSKKTTSELSAAKNGAAFSNQSNLSAKKGNSTLSEQSHNTGNASRQSSMNSTLRGSTSANACHPLNDSRKAQENAIQPADANGEVLKRANAVLHSRAHTPRTDSVLGSSILSKSRRANRLNATRTDNHPRDEDNRKTTRDGKPAAVPNAAARQNGTLSARRDNEKNSNREVAAASQEAATLTTGNESLLSREENLEAGGKAPQTVNSSLTSNPVTEDLSAKKENDQPSHSNGTGNLSTVVPYDEADTNLANNGVANPLLCSTQDGRGMQVGDTALLSAKDFRTTSIQVVDGASAHSEGENSEEWLQVPSLFYLFANLVELHEIQHQHHIDMNEMEARLRQNSSGSLASPWSRLREEQIGHLEKHISYSVFQVEGTVLNPLFATWSCGHLRKLVGEVTKGWRCGGPNSIQFKNASFLLLDAISADRSCQVRQTSLFYIWKYIGNVQSRIEVFVAFSVLTALAIVCLVLLGALGRQHLSACIVLSVVLGVTVLLQYALAMLVVHHNSYTDASATFFKDEALSATKENINKDDATQRLLDSFNDGESSASLWSATYSHPNGVGGNGFAFENGDLVQSANGLRTHGGANGVPEAPFLKYVGPNEARSRSPQREQLERDRENTVLMSGVSFEHHELNVRRQKEDYLREMHSNPLLGDVNELAFGGSLSRSRPLGQGSPRAKSRLVSGLGENISVTALIYCENQGIVEAIAALLWDRGFMILKRSYLQALDKAYHQGSERFKVFLLNVSDLLADSSALQLAISWVAERRSVFFCSDDASKFTPQMPVASRLELPLSSGDVDTLLLAGVGVDEDLNDVVTSPHDFQVPEYALGRRLGGGAYANVFEAELEPSGVKCAVKRIYLKDSEEHDDSTSEDDTQDGAGSQLRDIAQEVEIMSSLAHPNIVRYMFFERDDNCVSIFMELCSGGSLGSLIAESRIRDPIQMRSILTDITNAVAYLHNRRIVHRDLKPDNVLFRDGRAKVSDFGTAVLKHGALRHIKGTFAYMAPEILLGESYGKACDVWSIGCIAAEVLSVDLPQHGLGLPEMCDFYRDMNVDSALEIDCSAPLVRSFLLGCLQRNPNKRLTADELLRHPLLEADSIAMSKWAEVVVEKRRLKAASAASVKHRRDGSACFELNSRLDLHSDTNESLKSSQVLENTWRSVM